MQGFSPNAYAPNAFAATPAGSVVVPQPDTTKPTFQGSLAHTKTSSSITVDWSGANSSDDVAVARLEYRIGGGTYTPATSAEEAGQSHTFAGLAAGTAYQIEVRCVDTSGNASDPLSVTVTTVAGGSQPEGIPPVFAGSLAFTKTSTTITIDWSNTTSSDNVAVARREYRIGGSGAYAAASAGEESSEKHTFAGLTPSTVYQIEVRCVDTSGNVSQPLVVAVTTSAPASGGEPDTNYIRGTLATRKGVPQVSLAAVSWSLFMRRPGNMGAPVAEGTHTMTTGSAQFQIAVPAATVPAGWYFLVLSDGDGTTALAAPILVGP
ncbi:MULTISPECIES: fibronectin type III domain-containing protein [unclassified Massilia]|uniref:fibronectin type III domain-containing protein n=1 Tax=unclassified Massilia TaxID=2609279 RepID=UPI00177D522E|nr:MULTISPECIES: hypothetical protein [unclassified Massilia]MBD8531494.1 hypothetical protein [Massilia sp. CFBP 13647]MBD8673710.1 hypothetical protein [Massilia sp. CFBP 13721]